MNINKSLKLYPGPSPGVPVCSYATACIHNQLTPIVLIICVMCRAYACSYWTSQESSRTHLFL